MATMNRNVNLEEINSDAFMGISYLRHQSILQKAVLILGAVSAVGMNLAGTFVFNISVNKTLIITLIPLLIGVAFGCNYNEDLSLIKYFKLLISNPATRLYSKPTEDLVQLHKAAERIKEEEAQRKREEEKMSDEAQKQLLMKLLIGVVVMIVLFVIVLIVINSLKVDEVHHMVAAVGSMV